MERTLYKPAATGNKSIFLSGAAIKFIALGLMHLEHLHYLFEFSEGPPPWFRIDESLSVWLFFCFLGRLCHMTDTQRKLPECRFLQNGDGFMLLII